MNNIKRVSICLAICVAVISCTKDGNFVNGISKSNVRTFKMPDSDNSEIDFSTFIQRVNILPLETTSESIFRSVSDMIWQNGRIYIYDISLQELFAFDESGKFIFKLNRMGKGPEEYGSMRDFEIDEEGNIHILSNKEVVIYNADGKFQKRIPFSLPASYHINPTSLAFSGKTGYYLFSGAIGITKTIENQYSIYEITNEGKFTGKVFFPVTYRMFGEPRFYKLEGTTEPTYNMTPFVGNDTIYKFTAGGKAYPAYFLDYEDRHLPQEVYSGFDNGERIYNAFKTTNYVTGVHTVIESEDFIHFLFRSKSTLWSTFGSKKTGNFFYFEQVRGGRNGFLPIIYAANKNTFMGNTVAGELIDSKKSGEFKSKFGHLDNFSELEQIIDGLNENDNPVVVTYDIKEF